MPVILSIIDSVTAHRLNLLVDIFASSVPAAFLECARKKRQALDVVFALSLIIKKGLDDKSNACIAQSEIKQFYNHIRVIDIAEWIVRHFGHQDLASTFVRIHSCPSIDLRVGASQSP